MNTTRILGIAVALSFLFLGCGAGSNLVVIPPEIDQVQPPEAKYQGVHAVYLYDIAHLHYDPMDIGNSEAPSYVYSRYSKIKLLTRAATELEHYGNIPIRHTGELTDIGGYVLKRDGTKKELQKSDFYTNVLIKDVIEDATPPVDLFETVIVFPGLEVGDTIAYHYTRRGMSLNWTFNHMDAPVLYSKFMVARPPFRVEIQPLIVDRHNLKPEQGEDKGVATGMAGMVSISRQATYDIWTAKDIPAVSSEEGMPSLVDVGSSVGLWVGDRRWDWGTLGTTYYKWFTHYGRPPSKPGEIALKVVEGITSPRDRAKAIYAWVKQNLNIESYNELSWVPREIEITPVKVNKVLEEKNATPEQAASILWVMLQAVGVNATLVLATSNDDPPVEEGLPELYQLRYPLLALDDGTMLDTTDRYHPFGTVPWIFEGRKALWVKGDSVSFKNIPVTRQEDNRTSVKVSGEVAQDGGAKIGATFEMTGQMAYAMRKKVVPLNPKEREEWVRKQLTNSAEKAELDQFEFKNLEDPQQPVMLAVQSHVPGFAQVMRDKMVFKLGAFIDLSVCPVYNEDKPNEFHVCPTPVTEARANPVAFPFKRLDELEANVAFPAGFFLQALPKGFKTKEIDKGTVVGVQTSYGSQDRKAINVVRKFSVNEALVTKQGYPNLRDLIRRYLGQKDTLITLELPKLTD